MNTRISDPAARRPPRTAECAVVVVSYQSARQLPRLLSDLGAAQVRQVLVVDNCSTDDSRALAEAAGVEVLSTGANLGYAGALNLAWRTIPGDLPVLVLNPDLTMGPGAVRALLAAVHEQHAGVAVPMIVGPGGVLARSLRREPSVLRAFATALLGRRAGALSELVWSDAAYAGTAHVDWACGAALLITAECRRVVGEWDDARFFLYSEETDYLRRVRDAGFGVVYTPDAVVTHEGGGSGGDGELVALMAVNRVRYFEKHHGPAAARWFRAAVALHELLRSADPAHRAALRAVLHRPSWPDLPGGRA
ncbi:glycosyltransferase family 2 protein [Amycolatopsis minnesotensis]|uniref:Glycosyltransferase family 2 protein n=1 Tax=Amycolatopsis minnesotensis TaxID=337894 RepID=A0ABP5BI07_9PSEU